MNEISVVINIKKSKRGKKYTAEINQYALSILQEIGMGVGDAVEMIFDPKTKETKLKIKKKRGMTDQELYDSVMKKLREKND